ncbi:MAG: DMT family transporter [Lachnospirales bacterium]
MKLKNISAFFAILAAALYAINIPLSKFFLEKVDTTMMAAFLYLGAGIGMSILCFLKANFRKSDKKEPLTKKELPYTIAMVLLDILAPILLMIGISKTNSANVSLLNNFEIVATSIIALVIFKEAISKRLWTAIILVFMASVILSFEGNGAFSFSTGSLMVIGACICWGFENNCTKMISNKSSEEIVIIKGCISGLGSLIIALILGESIPSIYLILSVMLLGFVAYGLSINFYIMAQKNLGAAKTSAYYSIAPFLGVTFSMVILGERPEIKFYIALVIMIVSTIIMIKDSIELQHTHSHSHTHTHSHSHGNLVHTHPHTHTHSHLHIHNEDTNNHSHKHDDRLLTNHEHIHSI